MRKLFGGKRFVLDCVDSMIKLSIVQFKNVQFIVHPLYFNKLSLKRNLKKSLNCLLKNLCTLRKLHFNQVDLIFKMDKRIIITVGI